MRLGSGFGSYREGSKVRSEPTSEPNGPYSPSLRLQAIVARSIAVITYTHRYEITPHSGLQGLAESSSPRNTPSDDYIRI